jgi:hypothetical protein
MPAPVASGWSGRRVGLAPTGKAPPCHGARGKRPFGYRYGEATGNGKARDLIPDPAEQAALGEIAALRAAGQSLVAIRDAMRARGFGLCKQSILNILNRQEAGAAA